jgi:uncharacterized protein Smg (DUF494 family)
MRDLSGDAQILRLLKLLADHLEGFLEGDDFSFDTLSEAIEEGQYSADDIHAAIMALRGFSGEFEEDAQGAMEDIPGKRALRVWSAEERESVSPEAWGYLLGLRLKGSLDAGQFERVLDLLTASGVRPVGVDLAQEVATRVALQIHDREGGPDFEHGEVDLAN